SVSRDLHSFPTRRSSDLSDQYSDLTVELSDGRSETYNLGNSIQNGSTHQLNSSLDMKTFYRYIGLTKITPASKRQKAGRATGARSEEHTSELQSRENLVC